MTFNDFKSSFLESVTEFSIIDMVLAMLFACIVGLFIFLIYKKTLEIVFLFWSIAAGIVIGSGMILLAVIRSVVIGIILLIFVNRKSSDTPYILVLGCTDEKAEQAAMDTMRGLVDRCAVKSKTVSKNGIELTLKMRLKDAGASFVNRRSDIDGVDNAVLVIYNGQYMS
ncbi:MAG: DUF4956 domain-containing protein [Oscillospiraceae bacterium]